MLSSVLFTSKHLQITKDSYFKFPSFTYYFLHIPEQEVGVILNYFVEITFSTDLAI